VIGQQQRGDDAAIGWIEDVLAANAKDEFRANRRDRREDGDRGGIRAKEKAER